MVYPGIVNFLDVDVLVAQGVFVDVARFILDIAATGPIDDCFAFTPQASSTQGAKVPASMWIDYGMHR